MASPYILTNTDLQYVNLPNQSFNVYIAFLSPVAITTTWTDLQPDGSGAWLAPGNVDTAALHLQPYAPTANMGPNRIGFVNEPLYFDGTRSCQRHDLPVVQGSYQWSYSGNATFTFYNNASQIGISWSSPGLYSISLGVRDLAGTLTTAQRQVMIYPDRQSALPGVISLSGLSGSMSSGGWVCQLTTVNSQVSLLPPDALPVGTYQPVVIMIETIYEVVPGTVINRTIGPHGQFSPGYPYQDPRIFFDGYIQQGTYHQDVDKDTLSFSCVGPQMLLQEAKTHQLGYYNTSYTQIVNGVPLGCNPSAAGQGYLVGNLMTADVVHSILQNHTNIGTYHDIHCWNANIPTNPYSPGNPIAYYNLVYTGISIVEGTLWTNLQDICNSERDQVFCERDGSIRLGPQINHRGNEYWSNPTLLGPTVATTLINAIQDLGYTIPGKTLTAIAQNTPALPAQPFPIELVHPWGNQPVPPAVNAPFSLASPDVTSAQQALVGPPILCTFSDVPAYDAGVNPPQGVTLYPWIQYNWPQDLAVYPISFDIQGTYNGKTSLVKLIGTLAGSNNTWSCWYPQNTFQVAPGGTSITVNPTLPSGNWYVDQTIVLPDITKAQNGLLLSNWWWELARREYYAQNIQYNATVTLGLFTGCSLGDIVGITRQNNTLGTHWSAKPFYVTQIDYTLDMTQRTWTTTLTTTEVTSAFLTPITPPPAIVPKS